MSSNNIYYVYIYHDPENMKPFYVGKGKGRRYKEHLHEAKRKPFPCNNRKLNKIRKILKSGVDPVISFYLMDVTESVPPTFTLCSGYHLPSLSWTKHPAS